MIIDIEKNTALVIMKSSCWCKIQLAEYIFLQQQIQLITKYKTVRLVKRLVKRLIPCGQPSQKSQPLYFVWPVQLLQSLLASSLEVPFPRRKILLEVNSKYT